MLDRAAESVGTKFAGGPNLGFQYGFQLAFDERVFFPGRYCPQIQIDQ